MTSDAPPITQKLLVSAGGWPTMKSAQELHRAGRVIEADYQPPLLSGTVQEGPRSFRSGLRIKSASHIENVCTCRQSREWGTVCAHALAVGLAYMDRVNPSAATAGATTMKKPAASVSGPVAREPIARSASTARDSGPAFVEIGANASATSVRLHFILPPQFDSAWAKQKIMVVIEAELLSGSGDGGNGNAPRTMLSALAGGVGVVYACDPFDLAALDGLAQAAASGDAAAERLAPMRQFSREEFLRFLPALRGHPRVTFGKSTAAEISRARLRPTLRLSRQGTEGITLQPVTGPGEEMLVSQTEAWLKKGATFTSCAEGFPAEFLPFTAGPPQTLRGERALRFLALDAPRLHHWFEVQTGPGVVLPESRQATPAFALEIEGTMRELRATLRCRYPGGGPALTLGEHPAPGPAFYSSPDRPGVVLWRDAGAEAAAVGRLESFGFEPASAAGGGQRFVMRKENAIARFFAFGYPQLRAGNWNVTLSAQAEHFSRGLQPLAPAMEIVSSGENWFEMRYSLAAPDGQTLAPAELQRLLRSGQNQTRLGNGRTAVFDPESLGEFEEVLRDCEPVQHQPGVYRIERAHAGYLAATAQEAGARLTDLRGALARFAASSSGPAPNDAAAFPLPPDALGDRVTLRGYQAAGVTWLWRLANSGLGGILADEMGLGKTLQALVFLLAQHRRRDTDKATPAPALIVCPSSLLTNWRNEAQRFTPELKTLVLTGPDRHARFPEIAKSDLVITSYALLQRDAASYRALSFSTAILDEAQHIKNPDTQNAQAAFALRARNRFVLTGTPIENSVRDLWSLMNFAVPGYLGSRADFRERYETPLARGGVAAPDVQRRLTRRMRPFLLRRKKSDVAKELPEKIEQVLTCDLAPAQRATYDGLLREIQLGVATDRKGGGAKPNQAATRMKMLLGLLATAAGLLRSAAARGKCPETRGRCFREAGAARRIARGSDRRQPPGAGVQPVCFHADPDPAAARKRSHPLRLSRRSDKGAAGSRGPLSK